LIDSFLVVVYLTDAMEHLYFEEAPNSLSQTKHNEEGVKRRKQACGDRQQIGAEMEKTFPSTINQQ